MKTAKELGVPMLLAVATNVALVWSIYLLGIRECSIICFMP